MGNGTLEVTIVESRELKNKEGIFGHNDPYVLVKVGHQKYKTEVKPKAGKQATWNQTFRLGVMDSMKDLVLECYDQDTIKDDLIGKTTIPLGGILQNGQTDSWYVIGSGSKTTGEIHVLTRYHEGAYPDGFDPKGSEFQDNLEMGGKIAGGVLAAGAAAYGAKKLYDHYNKDDTKQN